MSDDRALREGSWLLDVGRPEAALEPLGRAIAQDPDDPRGHVLLTAALLQAQRPDEALAAGRRAVACDPEEPDAQRLLAVALVRLKRFGQARPIALRAAALDPESSATHTLLALVLQGAGDEAGARRAAEHAVALDPEDADAHHTLGVVLLDHEQLPDAERSFRAALRLDPEHQAAQNDLGVALVRQDRGEEAAAAYAGAVRLDPSDDVSRHNLEQIASRWANVGRFVGLLLGFFTVILLLGVRQDPVGALVGAAICFVPAYLGLLLAQRPSRSRAPSDVVWEAQRAAFAAKRLAPWRWDWSWLPHVRPWWWVLLSRTSPGVQLAINAALLLTLPSLLGVLAAIGLPFSARRAYRWWRRSHPAAGSWQAPS